MTPTSPSSANPAPEEVLAGPPKSDQLFNQWLSELTQLALDEGLEWMVTDSDQALRASFLAGKRPVDELIELSRLGQWQGCGCGGG